MSLSMDVIKSMKLLVKISQIFGLFPYRLNKFHDIYFLSESRTLLIYSKVLLSFLALVEGGSVISMNFSLSYTDEISTKFILLLSPMTLYISFVMIFRIVVKKRETISFWLNQFNNMCISGPVNENSGKLKRFNTKILVITTVYFALVVITKYLTYENASPHEMVLDIVFFARLWVIHIFLKHFVIFGNFVRFFYIKIHTNLKKSIGTENPRYWTKYLKDLRCKDLFVKDFVDVLHSIYMPVLFVQLIWFFVTLLCDITITGKAGMPTVMQADWMIYICSETILYTSVCHNIAKEARKTIACLQDLLLNIDDSELLYEIELLSLQLQHRKLKFNAFGFFTLDYTLLYSMIGATTTYTVILLQFQSDHMTKMPKGSQLNTPFLLKDVIKKGASEGNVTIPV